MISRLWRRDAEGRTALEVLHDLMLAVQQAHSDGRLEIGTGPDDPAEDERTDVQPVERAHNAPSPPLLYRTLVDEHLAEAADLMFSDPYPAEARVEAAINNLTKTCFWGNRRDILDALDLPYPVYDYLAVAQHNYDEGPLWRNRPQSSRRARSRGLHDFEVLGHPVRLPFGLAASPLTARKNWIDFYASRGYGLFTYKTVRTQKRQTYAEPTWLFTRGLAQLEEQAQAESEVAESWRGVWPEDRRSYSMANSMGVESATIDEWTLDVREIRTQILTDNQLLLVSVMGADYDEKDETNTTTLAEDYARAAKEALGAGADGVELNISNPNAREFTLSTITPPLDRGDVAAQLIREIVEGVRKEVGDEAKVVLKLGYHPMPRLLDLLTPVSDLINGVSGINAVQMRCLKPDEDSSRWTRETQIPETFDGGVHDDQGKVRERAGISGAAIRVLARDFVSSLVEVRRSLEATWDIIGIGGVSDAAGALDLLQDGATAVQCATAALFNPDLAGEVADELTQSELLVLNVLNRAAGADVDDIVSLSLLPRPRVEYVLGLLARAGLVSDRTSAGRCVYALERAALRARR